MTDSIHSASPVDLDTPAIDSRRIVRDSTFTRSVVDEIWPIILGRDLELSCLQFSPELRPAREEGKGYIADMEPVLAEVARVRIAWGDAVQMSMRILNQGITSGRVNGAVVAETITQWIAQAEVAEKGADDAA